MSDEGGARLDVDEVGAHAYEDACFPEVSAAAGSAADAAGSAEGQNAAAQVKAVKTPVTFVRQSISTGSSSTSSSPTVLRPFRRSRKPADASAESEVFHEDQDQYRDL